MSDEQSSDTKPDNYTPYYCNLCKIYCACPINLQTHFLGAKHKQLVEVLKSHGIVKPLYSTKEPKKNEEVLPDDSTPQTVSDKDPMRTLQEELDLCQDFEPAIGLQYITEHRTADDYPLYDCSLCGCQTRVSNMFMHVLGIRHRYAYVKKHHPDKLFITGKASIMNKRLKELAIRIEKIEGRHRIKVTKDPLVPNATGAFAASVPPPAYKVDSEFAEDDVCIEANLENDTYKETEAPTLEKKESAKMTEKKNPTLEKKETAKKIEKENPTLEKKETAKKIEKENPTLEKKETAKETEDSSEDEEANTQCDNRNKSGKQEDQNTGNQKNVVLKDYDESEEFDDDEELFKYLQSFEILDESDASFILNIIQKLTHVLVAYRYGLGKNNPRQPYPEKRFDARQRFDGPNTGFLGVQPPFQRPCDNQGTNMMVKSAFKRKATHLNTNRPKDNAKSFKRGSFVPTFKEIPKEQAFPDDDIEDADAIMQESPSKEAAPVAKMQEGASKDKAPVAKMQEGASKEKAPVVKMQEGASKGKAPGAKMQEGAFKEKAPVAKMQEGAFKEKAPVAKMQEGASKGKAPGAKMQEGAFKGKAPGVKMQEGAFKGKAPVAKMQEGAFKGKAPGAKMQEGAFKGKAPVAKMQEGASKGKAPGAKMQESHSREKAPETDAQQADTKMQESPSEERAPSAIPEKKNLPSSENLSNPTPDKKSSSQNHSAASNTTGSMPSTENNVIAQFFNSIRNMEIHEVAATLHQIAASNPAFHGMDVPNVLKILTMSGNLKPENTGGAQ